MSQRNRILNYIIENGRITQADAIKDLGCYRLSARIHELRESGERISSEMETGKNRYGETVSYAVYRLEEEDGRERQADIT